MASGAGGETVDVDDQSHHTIREGGRATCYTSIPPFTYVGVAQWLERRTVAPELRVRVPSSTPPLHDVSSAGRYAETVRIPNAGLIRKCADASEYHHPSAGDRARAGAKTTTDRCRDHGPSEGEEWTNR